MMNINKKILVFALILIFGTVIAGNVFAVSWRPLVPCGTSATGYALCTFCDIFKLVKNIFDFLTYEVAIPLSAVLVAIAGTYILTAGDNTTRLDTGKTILKSVVFSLLIIFGSWLVLNTALTLFAKPIGGGGGFFSFKCEAPPKPGELPNAGGTGTGGIACTANPANLDDNNKTTTFNVQTISNINGGGPTCVWPNSPTQGATYQNGNPSPKCSGSVTFASKNGGTVSVLVKDSKGNDIGTASCKVVNVGEGSGLTCNVSGLAPSSCVDAGQCPDCKTLTKTPSLQEAQSLADFLNNQLDPAFTQAGITYRIAEAMCPTNQHKSCAHFNGHAIDLGSAGGNLSQKMVQACQILNGLGLRGATGESSSDRGVYVLEAYSPGNPCPNVCGGAPGACGASPIHLQY